jgi:UDP-N-acetylmuramoyl-L-alanyl-D-glutamate--2,6-diaminopimelate ligase
MMTLGRLLADTVPQIPASLGDVVVRHLALSSRDVSPGSLFFALPGTIADGRDYIDDALRAGAVAVVAEGKGRREDLSSATSGAVVWVEDLAEHVGKIAAEFYGHPSSRLKVIGVTGTNGKTSVTQLAAQMINGIEGSHACAVLGTMGSGVPGETFVPSINTTADAISNQARLAELADRGVTHVAMEVSSHALEQCRVRGIDFDVVVFTNLTRDHLDYHGTLDSYAAAKARLFFDYDADAVVINLDDPWGRRWLSEGPCARQVSYGLQEDAMVRAAEIRSTPDGQAFALSTAEGLFPVTTPLMGRFNVYNLLAAGAALHELGYTWPDTVEQMGRVQPVSGRMERIAGFHGPTVVIDYAHTPDALDNALRALREHARGDLWCVFGCGGDRDPGKRPMMAKVAEQWADKVVVTDDNPRFEDGNRIVSDILAGFEHPEDVVVERDRARAIQLAICNARPGDVVLVAGKGHETYQSVRGSKLPHNDREHALRVLREIRPCG